MITVHYFSYKGDEVILPWTVASCVRAAAHSGLDYGKDIRIIVIDDAYAPCSDEAKKKCEDMDVEWRVSTFRRGGNLRGQDCLMGILSEFQATLRGGSRDDIIVKVDCDTIVRSFSWLLKFINVPEKKVTASDDRGAMYGMCYALRGELISSLTEYFAAMPIPERGQEDLYLGSRARILAGDDGWMPIPLWNRNRYRDDPNGPDGIITGYNWYAGQVTAKTWEQFQILNVGNNRPPHIPMSAVKALIEELVPEFSESMEIGAESTSLTWSEAQK